jgi:uncharacterized protein (DUF305 family)
MTDKLARLDRLTEPTRSHSRTTTRPGLIRIVRRGALLVGAVVVSVAIAGCGDNSASDTPPNAAPAPDTDSTAATTPDGPHNDADITFAEQVIPYQEQAVAMGRLTGNNSYLPQVKALGGRIATVQQQQIAELTGFLRAWNAPAPSTDMPTDAVHAINYGQSGPQHAASVSSPGMISGEGLRQLRQSNGPAFDTQFLQTMLGQHKAVIALAQTELRGGQNSDAKALAGRIIKAQQSEISEMQTILVGPDFGHF